MFAPQTSWRGFVQCLSSVAAGQEQPASNQGFFCGFKINQDNEFCVPGTACTSTLGYHYSFPSQGGKILHAKRALQKKNWFLKGWFKSWSGIKRKMMNWAWMKSDLHCCPSPARSQAQSSLTSLFFQKKGKKIIQGCVSGTWAMRPRSPGRREPREGHGARLGQPLALGPAQPGRVTALSCLCFPPQAQEEMLHVPPAGLLDNSKQINKYINKPSFSSKFPTQSLLPPSLLSP